MMPFDDGAPFVGPLSSRAQLPSLRRPSLRAYSCYPVLRCPTGFESKSANQLIIRNAPSAARAIDISRDAHILDRLQADYELHPSKRRGGEEIVSSSFMVWNCSLVVGLQILVASIDWGVLLRHI